MHAYRADIDGLRAVAVLMVILFHAGLGFPGGYIGVDVFFVISGYLITSIIYRDVSEGRFSMARFWLRRTRRIVPAVMAMTLGVLVAGYFLLTLNDYRQLSSMTVSMLLMGANVRFWENTNYFGGPAELIPILHTWSLAVEEQFYLAYPLLVVFANRWKRRGVMTMLVVLTVASLVGCLIVTPLFPKFSFFMLPTRAWEMLLGGIAALAPALSPAVARRWPAVQLTALAGLLVTSCVYTSKTPFPGFAAILPCVLATVLVYAPSPRGSLIGRLLHHPSMIAVGKVSYSAYLWHWPILCFLKHYYVLEVPLAARLLALAATALCAWVSYEVIEQPIRLRKWLPTTPRLLAGATVGFASLLAVSLTIRANEGVTSRLPQDVVQLELASRLPTKYRTKDAEGVRADRLPDVGVAVGEDAPLDFLVWGDSHVVAIGETVQGLASEYGLHGEIAARYGTPPLLETFKLHDREDMLRWNQAVIKYIRETGVRNVILGARWTVYYKGHATGELQPLLFDQDDPQRTIAASHAAYRRALHRTVATLREAGVRTWILKQVPLQDHDPCRVYLGRAMFGVAPHVPGVTLAQHHERQGEMIQLLDSVQADDVALLDPAVACFDANGVSLTGVPGATYYADANHLSRPGAEAFIRPLLEPVMRQIAYEKQANPQHGVPHIASPPGGRVTR